MMYSKHFTTVLRWVASAAVASLSASAQTTFSVAPWHSDNAVVLPVASLERKDSVWKFPTILEGTHSGDLRLEFSISPGKRFDVESLVASGKQRRWRFTYENMHFQTFPSLPPSTRFDVTAHAGGGKKDQKLGQITNLVAGQVWVLSVSPETDSIQLPRLTDSARRRVRVLALEGNSWEQALGRWQMAADAEALGQRKFCGLPRAFANWITDPSLNRDNNSVVGLILVQASVLKDQRNWAPGKRRRAVDSIPSGSEMPSASDYSMGRNAALFARSGGSQPAPMNTWGADVRLHLERLVHIERQVDLKRLGILGEMPPKPIHRWEWMLPGTDAMLGDVDQGVSFVPFRTTGVIWGVDPLDPLDRPPSGP